MTSATTVYLRETRIEVAVMHHGRPAYRWVRAFYVQAAGRGKECPPVRRIEAYQRARELGATADTIKVVSDAHTAEMPA